MSGQFTYNAEEAKAAILAVLPEVEDMINREIPASQDLMEEIAKKTNVGPLIRAAATAREDLDGLIAMIKQIVGEPGDTSDTGTVYGVLNRATGECEQFA